MERLQKAAILTELADQLRREGSWCGHTHMQKATYFLQSCSECRPGMSSSFTSTVPTRSN